MESDIFVGARIRLTNIKSVDFDPRISSTHKPPKGKVFVALVLGVEDKFPDSMENIMDGKEVKKILSKLTKGKSIGNINGCTISSATGVM